MAVVLPGPAANPAVAIAPAVPIVQPSEPAHVQSAVEALVQDAQEYARQNDVSLAEAMGRLRAQQDSVAITDRLQESCRDRLAGIAIEHRPVFRIVVLLTGSDAVADQIVSAGGLNVPVVFRTGAGATQEQLLAAIGDRRAAIQSALQSPAGIGIDPRTGELVVTIKAADAGADGGVALTARLQALAGVPLRIRIMDRPDLNLAVEGGSRVIGIEQSNGRRYACTTGFVVADATRTGIVTAAHCPYTLSYRDPDGTTVPLSFVGAWGARYQDVQVQVGTDVLRPLFYADSGKTAVRVVTSWRNRTSTRAGDVVCHRGERTGYSCAQVELIDYAPPGDLCGGPCEPVWVTVAGPSCGGGDSGGPVFSGTIAFGILKGGSYRRDGTCNFYYYMSTDYLPPGWSLLHE